MVSRICFVVMLVTLGMVWSPCLAAERTLVLREYLQQSWTDELLYYPFTADNGACDARSVTLTGPRGAVPVQLTDIVTWPGTHSVKSARLSFIAGLAPLAADTYTIRYGTQAAAVGPATDLRVTATPEQVEITTQHFGARLLLGARTFPQPVPAAQVPGPVIALRMGDGTWFGGSRMAGPGKIAGYSAVLTDSGPVFARVETKYTYYNGNTLTLAMLVAAGDNTMRMDERVPKDQSADSCELIMSRGLPPFIFQVWNEGRMDRPCFKKGYGSAGEWDQWEEVPLTDYTAPAGNPPNLVTRLSPWEDWFGTFTQRTIRLKLDSTTRELQIHSLDPGAWVEPKDIRAIFSTDANPDPAKGVWVGWSQKMLPVLRNANGDIVLQVNAAQGVRKWMISDCLSTNTWKEMTVGPTPETRPAIGCRLDEVKDFVLAWPGDAGTHPRLWMSKTALEAKWARKDADPAILAELIRGGAAKTPESAVSVAVSGGNSNNALGAYLLSGGSPEVAQQTQMLARLRKNLQCDPKALMFCVGQVCSFYDALIDSPVVPETERASLRAQMANLAYGMADPATWSAERGYCSGNSNMTVNFVMGLGMIACTIPDHPMAKSWYRSADLMMDQFLTNMVGPNGEWPEAMGHHGLVSVAAIETFAIASTNAGFRDYVNDPRLKRLMLYQAKLHTPRDPRPRGPAYIDADLQNNRRYIPAMGRDSFSADQNWALSGIMARATAKSDPAYSAAMQWLWLQCGPRAWQSTYKMGGFEYVYCDRSLPAKKPDWGSEVFPRAGVVLRQGLDTADEHMVMLYSGDHTHAFYPQHAGSIPAIFAYGKPVAGCFAGDYWFQERFLTCHVDIAGPLGTLAERKAVSGYDGGARKGEGMWGWPDADAPQARFGEYGGAANVSAFSTLPRQDYAAIDVALHRAVPMNLEWRTTLPAWPATPVGKTPVDWRRQVLWLKSDDPAGPAYLLLRDSVQGGATMWQMWTLSELLDTPDNLKDVTAALANKPGYKLLPARELKGDRFTAIGQQGVDIEYFIASPADTPRYTLRWGAEKYDWANNLKEPEYQDLLHLQLPGDGAYYLAFYPRKRGTPAPAFSTLGEGRIIKVQGNFGVDYGFLSTRETTAAGDGASFSGTAASVQARADGTVLSLGASGTVRYQEFALAAAFPASLRVAGKALTLELPAGIQPPAFGLMQPFPGGAVTITAPGTLALAKGLRGVKLAKTAAGWTLTVPSGIRSISLTSR